MLKFACAALWISIGVVFSAGFVLPPRAYSQNSERTSTQLKITQHRTNDELLHFLDRHDINGINQYISRLRDEGNPISEQLELVWETAASAREHFDFINAALLFQSASDFGLAKATTDLGYMYLNGFGVPQSDERAVALFQKAIGQGDGLGKTNLAYMYILGRGVPRSFQQAIRLYREVVQEYSPETQEAQVAQKKLNLLLSPPQHEKHFNGLYFPLFQGYQPDITTAQLNTALSKIGLDRYFSVIGKRDFENATISLLIQFRHAEDQLRERYEQAFFKKFGMSVWEKTLVLYSAISGLPVSRLEVRGKTLLGCRTFFADGFDGRVKSHEAGCISGTTSFRIVRQPSTIAAAARGAIRECSQTEQLVEQAITHYMEGRKGETKVIDSGDNHLQLVVRNLHGEVIRGGRDWEKIGIFIVWYKPEGNTAHSPRAVEFRLILDGYLASGMGDFPPDTAFTTSMEPKHFLALSEYTKQLGLALKVALHNKCGS